jgi:hypothetical protein
MTTPFWSNDPTILFNKESILQVWPTQQMTFEAKLNAISRIVLIMTILGFLFTRNVNILIIAVITLAIMFSIYKLRKQSIVSSLLKKEGFSLNPSFPTGSSALSPATLSPAAITTNPVTLESVLRSNFHPTTKKNPMGNVLLTDIMDTPNRLAAAPSFNPDVYEDIDTAVKKQTQMLNPGIINTNKQLYGDLYSNYQLDNSMMRFYSTANSRIASDQGAFSQYLYGNMPSSKSSGPDGAFQRVADSYRYILI